jgi:hypothetical protein
MADWSNVLDELAGRAFSSIDGAMLEICGSAWEGAYLPG